MKRFLAALIFFTRLPFWRIAQPPAECYKRVVDYWSAIGWLTGGVTALVLALAAWIFPPTVAVIIAFASRLFLTGALHEDGMADFFDGMGGGTSRERILAIMKDSHIGTYGVIGLIVYYLLVVSLISSLPVMVACLVIFAGDTWSKFCASQIINFLPYARKESEAKNHTVYSGMSTVTWLVSFLFGALPLYLLPRNYLFAAICPMVVSMTLIVLMRRKLQGYTGDCCGATFLLSELSFYLGIVAIQGI